MVLLIIITMSLLICLLSVYSLKDKKSVKNKKGDYGRDFTINCVFDDQIKYKKIHNSGSSGTCIVPMESGRIALYEFKCDERNMGWSDTGQKNWHFEFIKFIDENEKQIFLEKSARNEQERAMCWSSGA